MLKFLGSALGIVALIYAVFMGFVYFFQDRLVYAPQTGIHSTPKEVDLDFQEVLLTTRDDVNIHGWFVPARDEKGVVLFCHGNAGNISHRLPTLQFLRSLGMSTFIFDYRGFGKSQGTPTEEGTYLDVRAAWNFLTQERGYSPQDIFIMGRSLGGAVAADLATETRPAGIVLESTFTDIPSLGQDMFPFLLAPDLLARFSYDTRSKLAEFTAPVLIIHSRDDDLIPFRHGQALYDGAREPKEFLEIQGDHDTAHIKSQEKYLNGLQEFFNRHRSD